MTTATTARPARRRITLAAFRTEAIKRFGNKPSTWRFRCPACGHTQSAADLPAGRAEHVAQACFGCEFVSDTAAGPTLAALLRITMPDGTKTDSFPLADEFDDTEGHSATLTAHQDPTGIRIPASPLRPGGAAAAPVPQPSEPSPSATETESED